jgi:hypothetical protein
MSLRKPVLSKEAIIKTYKDMVAIRDGRLVGRGVFLRGSRLPTKYWQGRYWNSWSEFQAECGFTPNRPNTRIPDEIIFRRYVELALELKKLPVSVDLKVKRKADRSFPNHSAFDRLGAGDERLDRVAAYCEGKPEIAPVLELIRRRREKKVWAPTHYSRRETGLVYLTRHGDDYKIGRIDASGGRLPAEFLLLAQRPETVHAIRTDDPAGVERYWRSRFRLRRQARNCFRLSDQDLADFRHRRYQ